MENWQDGSTKERDPGSRWPQIWNLRVPGRQDSFNMNTLSVVRKRNGEIAIYAPIAGLTNVPVVALQTDGEIRWASVGPQTPENAILFSNAVRLAIRYSQYSQGGIHEGQDGYTTAGLCWNEKSEVM